MHVSPFVSVPYADKKFLGSACPVLSSLYFMYKYSRIDLIIEHMTMQDYQNNVITQISYKDFLYQK
ncbi:MAG: hypothetical protein PVSMB5_14330 [Ktedonobacteraceae bacterium]